MLEEAGFEAVDAQDRTEQFTAILQSELERFIGMKEEFLQVTTGVNQFYLLLQWYKLAHDLYRLMQHLVIVHQSHGNLVWRESK